MILASTSVIETVNNLGFNLAGMEPGEIIKREREKRGWSQADLAKVVGISQPAIKKIEDGETHKSRFLPQIAVRLGIDLTEIDPSFAGEPDAATVIPRERLVAPGQDFPIYASAEGGKGEVIITSDPVDYVPRPGHLVHVKGAYGLLVVGTSMEPEYRPGNTALVDPNLPIIGGEVYIFYAEREGMARATIKELRRANHDTWFVLQHNPPKGAPKEFTLSRREWQWAHRVIGKYTRR
jgi:phage repressor protein C with HTH and peptisase S24 domain